MKKSHFILSGALLLGLAACQKDAMNHVTSKPHNPQKVQQKFYNVSGVEVTQMVHQFKASRTNAAMRDGDDSIPVDSSIYVIEAALNSELAGLNDRNYEFTNYSVTFDAIANEQTQKISGSQIDEAYNNLESAITTTVDQAMQRVKVIDIEAAFTSPTVVTYTAQYSVMNTSTVLNCSVPLGIFNFLSAQAAMNSISPSLVACAAPANVDALATIQYAVNCPLVYGGCTTSQGGDGFIHFYNVGQHYITSGGNVASNPNTNELFATQMYNGCTWCNTVPGVLTLNNAQVNNYITNINTFINSPLVCPTPNYVPIQVTMGWQVMNGTNSSCGQYKSFGWDLTATSGIAYCGANPN